MTSLGLIGFPLEHSLSPRIQQAALDYAHLKGSYDLFPIAPDDLAGLRDLLERLRGAEITGLNVTIPHKQNVISLLDALTPEAQAIGAVNTIVCKEGKLLGANTDAPGFLADLKDVFPQPPWERVKRKHALVLGAGGAARAVVYALFIGRLAGYAGRPAARTGADPGGRYGWAAGQCDRDRFTAGCVTATD